MSESRPPYVVFEVRAVEDREASIESGHYVAKDVHYAIITPPGTKDRIEKEANAWLHDLRDMVNQERFPGTWLAAYERAYKDFQESRETPLDGIAVTDWPGVSPAQVRMLLDLNIRTVEHLAEATEEAIGRMGMGGRALKSKAQAYLDACKDSGKVSEQLAALRQQVEELTARDTAREEELKTLQREKAALEAASAKK